MTKILTITRGIPHPVDDLLPTEVIPFEVEGETFRQCFMQADELAIAVGEHRGFKLDGDGTRVTSLALSLTNKYGQKGTDYALQGEQEAIDRYLARRVAFLARLARLAA